MWRVHSLSGLTTAGFPLSGWIGWDTQCRYSGERCQWGGCCWWHTSTLKQTSNRVVMRDECWGQEKDDEVALFVTRILWEIRSQASELPSTVPVWKPFLLMLKAKCLHCYMSKQNICYDEESWLYFVFLVGMHRHRYAWCIRFSSFPKKLASGRQPLITESAERK